MKKNQFSFEEPVSKTHKSNVLRAAQVELDLNKKSSVGFFAKPWLSLTCAAAFAAVVYFQVVAPVNKTSDFETAMSENLLMELAALSPEEVQVVEDLEFIEALDKLSPEELEEVLL